MGNPLLELQQHGQSVWLDYIRRKSLLSGDVRKLIDEDGLRGMTANPSIFQAAIAAGDDYDETIARLVRSGAEPNTIYETIAVEDIQEACDQFRAVYDATDGLDGLVSLEVSPALAYDTQGTIEEARRLWKWVDRPNLMIKVPGLPPGVPAIETLLAEGINVNVTLLFAIEAYEAVAWAYVRALETRAAAGQPVDRIASVASFFVSRVDVLIDPKLDKMAADETDAAKKAKIQGLRGKAAIANAKLAYQSFKTDLRRCAVQGARGEGRPRPATALGQHQRQGQGVLRPALRRGADRPGHRGHDAARDARRVPRPRQGGGHGRAGHPGRAGGAGRAGRDRHRHEAGHRPA